LLSKAGDRDKKGATGETPLTLEKEKEPKDKG